MSNNSYGTILKSSSLIGGSKVINYGIGLLRTKVVAVLLGPAGVGLVGVYAAILSLAETISGLGLRTSGVREIANARSQADDELLGQLQLAIRRLAILLGVLGAIFLALAAPYVSRLSFGDQGAGLAIAVLALVLILKAVNVSQSVSIQGFRRIGSLARISVVSSLITTAVVIGLYAVLGEAGIIPALIAMALVSVLVSWRVAKKLQIRPDDAAWATSYRHAKRLMGMGVAIAYGSLLFHLTPFIARSLIVREMGLDANGIYMAAWAISGLFAQFILSAMAADYFPRLSEVSDQSETMNRCVNEQTEIGILAALPGILAVTAFAPLVIQVLYTSKFAPAADLLPWFLLGVFGRVVNWPMGMVVLAKGDTKTFALIQTFSVSVNLCLIYMCFSLWGLLGAAIAFGLHNTLYCPAIYAFLKRRYGLRWSAEVKYLLLVFLLFLAALSCLRIITDSELIYYGLSSFLIGVSCLFCSRQLYRRMSDHPKFSKVIMRLPALLRRILIGSLESK
ncbi:MAG: O-antigen translocase [Opitutae bacterium]|nr:O-antigen translocase [Opitutae bacterium]